MNFKQKIEELVSPLAEILWGEVCVSHEGETIFHADYNRYDGIGSKSINQRSFLESLENVPVPDDCDLWFTIMYNHGWIEPLVDDATLMGLKYTPIPQMTQVHYIVSKI